MKNEFKKSIIIGYIKEVNEWLNSSECQTVFSYMKDKLISEIEETRKHVNITHHEVNVYIASDNEQVKTAFIELIGNKTFGDNSSGKNFTINAMRVATKFVMHVKNLAKMQQDTNTEGK